MRDSWKQLMWIGLLCWGLIYAGYIVGKIHTENRVTKNLESFYTYVDSTTPMSDFRRYIRLSTAAQAIDWAQGVPEDVVEEAP